MEKEIELKDGTKAKIRLLSLSDVDKMADLASIAFAKSDRQNPIQARNRAAKNFRRILGNADGSKKNRMFGAFIGDVLVGMSAAEPYLDFKRYPKYDPADLKIAFSSRLLKLKEVCLIGDLAVHPDHRSKGISSALLSIAEGHARDAGFKAVYSQVAVDLQEPITPNMLARRGWAKLLPYTIPARGLHFADMVKKLD